MNERRLPRPEEPDYNIYHQFMNARIREMYLAARTRIPELGIEIRVDMDRYEDGSGEVSWLESDNFTDIDVTRYTYWAPFMGAENRGELLSSDRALELLRHSLHRMTRGGGHRDHIVDQFNFVDDAPKFHGIHARIEPDQGFAIPGGRSTRDAPAECGIRHLGVSRLPAECALQPQVLHGTGGLASSER